jgi:superfamily II DNA or RNA helicase
MSNYQYQTTAALKTLNEVLTNKYIGGVIAAVPGSGKTQMSFIFINEYIKKFPNAKIVVLTHNMNVLKNQYLDDLSNSHVRINFTFGDFRTDAQVRVGLPASIKNLEWDKIDLLIVDEAHEYWGENLVNSIYKDLTPNHVLLLTGSPSTFAKHNHAVDTIYKTHKKYFIYYISGSELTQNNVFAPVSLDSVAKGQTTKQTLLNALNRAKDKSYNMDKILIACKNSSEARIVSYQMIEMGRKVSLSLAENDSDSEQFRSFIDGDTDVLVVVRRGVLGFSDNNLTLVIDMKCSSDLETRFQLLARILRKRSDGVRKTYLTVHKSCGYNKEVVMLNKLVKFMDKKFFSSYAG